MKTSHEETKLTKNRKKLRAIRFFAVDFRRNLP